MTKREEIERLKCRVTTAEELIAEVRARAILKPDYHPDDVAFTQADRDAWGKMLNDSCAPSPESARIAELEAELAAVTAERDALQARIDAGERLGGRAKAAERKCCTLDFDLSIARQEIKGLTAERDALQAKIDAGTGVHFADVETALLIDRQPIAQDERKGERRKVQAPVTPKATVWRGDSWHRVERIGFDRRVTAGTVADRKVGK